LATSISNKTKAIIPVSLYGRCADFEAINEVANTHTIPVIEDAAQSFGSTVSGKKSCNLSSIACTSFFPSKPLGCYGDGGAIFTNDTELAEIIRQIARHGQTRRYHHVRVGVNSRLDTIQAAILLEKLKILDSEIAARHEIASAYNQAFASIKEILTPQLDETNRSAWAQYTIRTTNREQLTTKLAAQKIPDAIHYPLPMYRQPAVLDATVYLTNSETAANEVLSLPIHAYMDKATVDKIVDVICS